MGALRTYLDTSVLVGLFTKDPVSERADAAVRAQPIQAILSDWAKAELASAVAIKVRTGLVTRSGAETAFAAFDTWAASAAQQVAVAASDLAAATAYLRRLDLNLRAPDAIQIAVAQRLGATLLTFDAKMAAAAQALGCPVLAG